MVHSLSTDRQAMLGSSRGLLLALLFSVLLSGGRQLPLASHIRSANLERAEFRKNWIATRLPSRLWEKEAGSNGHAGVLGAMPHLMVAWQLRPASVSILRPPLFQLKRWTSAYLARAPPQ